MVKPTIVINQQGFWTLLKHAQAISGDFLLSGRHLLKCSQAAPNWLDSKSRRAMAKSVYLNRLNRLRELPAGFELHIETETTLVTRKICGNEYIYIDILWDLD